jgi:PAS domain S-box-containing protein
MKLARARSIRSKLNFILIATTLVALFVAAAALLAFDLRKQRQAIEQDLVVQADVIALTSAPALAFSDPKVAAENLSVLRAKPGALGAALYDEKGDLFASYRPGGAGALQLPGSARATDLRVEDGSAIAWRPVMSNNERVGTIYLALRDDRLQRTTEYVVALVLIMGGSLAAALLLSNRLQRALTAPILDVSNVAQKILRGETAALRASKTSEDEVGALVDAFNAMLDELGRRARTLEHTNEALRNSETRYQLAVRGSSAGLWDWDIRAGTMFYSPRFKALLGYTDEEMPDAPSSIGPLLHEADRPAVQAAVRAHLKHRVPYQLECRLQDRAGRWRWFLVAGMAMWDERGRAYRMAGSVVEVTERKEAEQVLQDANRAKDEFLATLAHELRNPLAPIRTGLEILKKDSGNGRPSQQARETMERQLTHMVRLIDDLLDISRINNGKIRLDVQRLRLSSVVSSAMEICRPVVAAGGHVLEVDTSGGDIELMGDHTRLAQALGNLLNNAAKYTPAGGRLALRVHRDGAHACIDVQDNGEGIPSEMLEKIFSLFAQVRGSLERSQGGLGIGLYLVRNLVELHGGTVVARSAGLGQGSTFTVRLPCLPPQVEASQPAAAARTAPGRGLKVLLVDDNIDAAETLATVLGMSEHRTRTVHDGVKVLACALEFQPDVILLDIGLPGMSGHEVAAQLRREPRFARTLLIAITGWGTEQDRRRTQEAGFDHHLTKPIDFSALESLLQAACSDGGTPESRGA